MVGGFVSVLAALIAVYGIIPATSASVSVAPTSPIRPSEATEGFRPFILPFRISNDGNTRLSNVRVECDWLHLSFSNGNQLDYVEVSSSAVSANYIEPNGQMDALCEGEHPSLVFPADVRLMEADMTFFISYKPRWRLQQRTVVFPFEGFREADDGRFRWIRDAPIEVDPEEVDPEVAR